MAIFNNSSDKFNTKTTIIADDILIKGEVTTKSVIYVDGTIEGTIHSQNTIAVGKTGTIKGQAVAQKVVISGVFEGTIEAEHIEILNGGVLNGDILSSNLLIESGATFNGKSISKKSPPSDKKPSQNDKKPASPEPGPASDSAK